MKAHDDDNGDEYNDIVVVAAAHLSLGLGFDYKAIIKKIISIMKLSTH